MFESREEFEEALAKSNQSMQESLEKAKKMGGGFFNMDHANAAANSKDHAEAKKAAHAAVDSYKGATPANIAKAKLMIDKSKNVNHLAMGISNHVLAHPSEGLKITKSREEFEEVLTKSNQGMQEILEKASFDVGYKKPKTEEAKPKNSKSEGKAQKPMYFNMKHVDAAAKNASHSDAKAAAHKAVDAHDTSGTPKTHTQKAKSMIDRSKDSVHLANGMKNFMLAHPSENLSVSRGNTLPIDNKVQEKKTLTEGEKIDLSRNMKIQSNKGKDVGKVMNQYKPTEAGKADVKNKGSKVIRRAKKDNLVKALEEAGFRQSALLLSNWDEMDSTAEVLSKSLES